MHIKVRKKLQKFLKVDFVRFCLVGGLGFFINYTVLTFFYRVIHLPVFISQIIGGEIALFSNFYLHHTWTYGDHETKKSLKLLLVQFHLTSWFAVLLTAVIVALGVNEFNLHYFKALIIAGIVALSWNYLWSKYVVWSRSANESSGDR